MLDSWGTLNRPRTNKLNTEHAATLVGTYEVITFLIVRAITLLNSYMTIECDGSDKYHPISDIIRYT